MINRKSFLLLSRIADVISAHRYELIAFFTGASVMILEIVGARLIAPYFGTSTYVWTSMIGVILGSLSLGFWYGGRLADRYDSKQDLGLIVAGAALLVLVMSFLQEPVLSLLASRQFDLRLSSAIAALVLFGPPSLLIGMVSPHLAKLRVTSLTTTGATIGRLEAAGAIGSIGGTFLSGYWLLAYFGARSVTLWLVVLLVLTSFLASPRRLAWPRVAIGLLAVALLGYTSLPPGIISDTDSAYSRYQVARSFRNGRPVHMLLTDRQSTQSAAYPDAPTELVFPYTQVMARTVTNLPSIQRVLIIGGGAHTLPTSLGRLLPEVTIDVVEIDPALNSISRSYFGYSDLPNVHTYYEDARAFINNSRNNYDLILVDAFNTLTPPFHLSSREAVQQVEQNLSEDGAIVVNAPTDFYGAFLPSLQKTYASVFSETSVRQSETVELSERQNFVIIATRNSSTHREVEVGLLSRVNPPGKGILLTDNYAPVERLSF